MTEINPQPEPPAASEFALQAPAILAGLASLGAAAIWWTTGAPPSPEVVTAWSDTAAAALALIGGLLSLYARLRPTEQARRRVRWTPRP
jgi:hypothetical protein